MKRPIVLVAGYMFKFIDQMMDRLKNELQVHYDQTVGGATGRHGFPAGDMAEIARSADVIVCESCLHNAVWYSCYKASWQRLIVRLHYSEAYTDRGFPQRTKMKNVDRMVFIAPYIMRTAINRFSWDKFRSRIEYIPNYVDCDLFDREKLPESRFTIGMSQAFPVRKRLDRALNILEEVRRKDQRFVLRIKGYNGIDDLVKKSPLVSGYYEIQGERIERSGTLKGAVLWDPWAPDMPEWYRKIGYIISSSDGEGSHQSLPEGAASRSVPISMLWTGVDELYPWGWICRKETGISKAILRIDREGNREERGEEARRFVEREFDIDKITRRWKDLILAKEAK